MSNFGGRKATFLPPPTDWMDRAACQGMDVNAFVPPATYTGVPKARRARQQMDRLIRTVCGPCPVREQCLQFGLATRSEGIWGGTTTAQRKAMHPRLHT